MDSPKKPLRLAVLGFWHVHAHDYANSARQHPETEPVAAWDHDPERGRREAERAGVEFVADLDALLARDDVDGVTVTTETTRHDDVIGRALAAGKHVFTEKLLSPTVAGAESLVAAARANGASLGVSLPRFAQPEVVAALEAVRSGSLGEPLFARVRLGHDGWVANWLPDTFAVVEDAIGGALTDLGCHPVYVLQALLGDDAVAVSAVYGDWSGHGVDDNSVVTARYANGAVGVAEASFVEKPGFFSIEVRGTAGSLFYGLGSDAVRVKTDGDWTELPLPAAPASPFATWVDSIRSGSQPDLYQQAAVSLTRFVVAANASAARGAAVDPTDLNEEHTA